VRMGPDRGKGASPFGKSSEGKKKICLQKKRHMRGISIYNLGRKSAEKKKKKRGCEEGGTQNQEAPPCSKKLVGKEVTADRGRCLGEPRVL